MCFCVSESNNPSKLFFDHIKRLGKYTQLVKIWFFEPNRWFFCIYVCVFIVYIYAYQYRCMVMSKLYIRKISRSGHCVYKDNKINHHHLCNIIEKSILYLYLYMYVYCICLYLSKYVMYYLTIYRLVCIVYEVIYINKNTLW